MISGILWWEPNITFWYGGRIFKASYSNLTKCQNSGEEEAGDSELPRPTQSNTDGNECCVIYQELPILDNVKQTVTAEINLRPSTGNVLLSGYSLSDAGVPCSAWSGIPRCCVRGLSGGGGEARWGARRAKCWHQSLPNPNSQAELQHCQETSVSNLW